MLVLLFYGQFRFNKECTDSVKSSLIDHNNCIIFCHFWKTIDGKTADERDVKYFIETVKPSVIKMEEQKTFDYTDVYPNLRKDVISEMENGIFEKYQIPNSHMLKSVFGNTSQLYSKFVVNEMKNEHLTEKNDTDIVMLTRSDIFFDRPISFEKIKVSPKTIYSEKKRMDRLQ